MPGGHDPEFCAAVPHRYLTYMAVWCPHHQQWSLRASKYVETGLESSPLDLETRVLPLGPFDTELDARNALVDWVTEDLGAGD